MNTRFHNGTSRAMFSIVWLLLAVLLMSAGPKQEERQLQARITQLSARGDYMGALRLIDELTTRNPSYNNLKQKLDLELRLKREADARLSILHIEAGLDGWPDRLSGFSAFQQAATVAESWYRVGEREKAEFTWNRMKELAQSPNLSITVFQSYRRIKLFDDALDWVRGQRLRYSDPDLWALDVSQVLEQRGECEAAFEEVVLYLGGAGDRGLRSAGRRALKLAQDCAGGDSLLSHMRRRALEELESGRSRTAMIVMDVMVQQRRTKEAGELVWLLDKGDGSLPFNLAQTLANDREWTAVLAILERMRADSSPLCGIEEFSLLMGQCLRELGRYAESLAEFVSLGDSSSPLGWRARLEAARLLHRPLGKIEQAEERLARVLELNPELYEAALHRVQLLGVLQRYKEADRLLRSTRRTRKPGSAAGVELEFLAIRLAWWEGRITDCRSAISEFLTNSDAHPIFNDAIDLMDLLSFSTTDSIAVVLAGRSDRLAFGGRVDEALEILGEAAVTVGSGAAEWLDWRACGLSAAEQDPARALERIEGYRGRHPDSIRLDRLAWMEIELMERLGVPGERLLRACEDLLERWPASILQDRVRRKIRRLEEEGA